jgi:glycerophosphoryl diester phosphodiesterase
VPPHLLRIAHRGVPPRERENTLASFALALAEGATGIELDVHQTRDGVIVVHHDEVLADGRAITDCALGELRRGAGPLEIPSLTEVFDLVRGTAELFVEIKGAGIEHQVAEVLGRYAGPAAIHSFDHAAIRRLADAQVRWRLGVLTEDGGDDPADLLRRHGALDYWPHEPLVDSAVIRSVHAMGGRVIPWTVNAPQRMRELAALAVDGICTDDARELCAALAAIESG